MIDQILQKIVILLKKANFDTFALDNFSSKKNKFCFDILVKKNDLIFSVKVFPNIDNINSDIINDIKSLSLILKSKPLLIGIKNRYQNLEDNTIYVRDGLPFITINTLEKILDNNIYPYVLAKRGGGIVFINGNVMKTLRESQEISRKELSEKIGVTKRTICAYENESMHPSDKIAENIKNILGNSEFFKEINVLNWKFKYDMEKSDIIEEVELSDFESHLQTIIEDIGICSYWYKKSSIPFKLSLYSTDDKSKIEGFYPLFSGVSEDQNKIKALNPRCLKIFTNLFHKTALFIINNNIKIPDSFLKNKIPIVRIKNLEEIDDEEEFIELVQDS
ncbi:MAG: helix-turn-helix domain-containing protein [Promethearchaeota archaeon]